MELTNKKISYSVTNATETMKLSGEISLSEPNIRIISFSGSISSMTEPKMMGNFHYSESEDGKVNRSVNSINKQDLTEAENLIDTTVEQVKAQEVKL